MVTFSWSSIHILEIYPDVIILSLLKKNIYLPGINYNKNGHPHQCGTPLFASISFTSETAFYIDIFGEIKIDKKIQRPKILKI